MSFIKDLIKDMVITFTLTVTTLVGLAVYGLIWSEIEKHVKNIKK